MNHLTETQGFSFINYCRVLTARLQPDFTDALGGSVDWVGRKAGRQFGRYRQVDWVSRCRQVGRIQRAEFSAHPSIYLAESSSSTNLIEIYLPNLAASSNTPIVTSAQVINVEWNGDDEKMRSYHERHTHTHTTDQARLQQGEDDLLGGVITETARSVGFSMALNDLNTGTPSMLSSFGLMGMAVFFCSR